MATLFYHPLSAPSRAVLLWRAATGAEVGLEEVDLFLAEQQCAAFARLSPGGGVPLLLDGCASLHEVGAILRLLARRHAARVPQAAHWCPSPPAHAARVDQVLFWSRVHLLHAADLLLHHRVWRPASALPHLPAQAVEAEEAEAAVARGLARLEQLLAADAFLAGAEATVADLVVAEALLPLQLLCSLPLPPAVEQWLARLQDALPAQAWQDVHAPLLAFAKAVRADLPSLA